MRPDADVGNFAETFFEFFFDFLLPVSRFRSILLSVNGRRRLDTEPHAVVLAEAVISGFTPRGSSF